MSGEGKPGARSLLNEVLTKLRADLDAARASSQQALEVAWSEVDKAKAALALVTKSRESWKATAISLAEKLGEVEGARIVEQGRAEDKPAAPEPTEVQDPVRTLLTNRIRRRAPAPTGGKAKP